MNTRISRLVLVMAIFSMAPVWAQTQDGSAIANDHAQHQQGDKISTPAVKKDGGDSMQGMDHGNMKTQGGSAPADARDPHAYSGGYTLDKGPYALPGTRQLRLSDEHNFGSVLFDRLERAYSRDGNATVYDAQAWFGRDYDRLVIKAEGDVAKGKLQEARTELLWGHAIAPFLGYPIGSALRQRHRT